MLRIICAHFVRKVLLQSEGGDGSYYTKLMHAQTCTRARTHIPSRSNTGIVERDVILFSPSAGLIKVTHSTR